MYVIPLLCLGLFSCSSDDDAGDNNDNNVGFITEDLLNSDSLISFDIVSAELENGDIADCYQLVFSSNPTRFETGPYCPETDQDTAGLSFYDGTTNPGLRVWSADFLTDLETDGFDFVSDDGTVHIEDFSGSTANDPDTYSYCLDGQDQDVQITFLIPVTPVVADEVNDIGEIELVGVSIDGVPMNGEPPSALNGPGGGMVMGGMGMMGAADDSNDETIETAMIPSLDPCGGHNDPSGYYHWHFVPEVATQVLVNNGITEIECTNITQVTTGHVLSGFAKDGYPIYAYAIEPDGLDECGGLTAPTDDFPDGVYHYVASTTVAPNVPACLVGVAALNNFEAN